MFALFKLTLRLCLIKTEQKERVFHAEAANQTAYWKTKMVEERFAAAMYLNSIAYNFDVNNLPRLDRTAFKTRKHLSK